MNKLKSLFNLARMKRWLKEHPFEIPVLKEIGNGDYIIEDAE